MAFLNHFVLATAAFFQNIFAWVVPLIALLIIGFILYSLLPNIWQWLANNKKPVEKEQGKIVSKYVNAKGRSTEGQKKKIGSSSRIQTTYHVTVELENTEQAEFKIPMNASNNINLSYRGNSSSHIWEAVT
ncbi:DUF2500 family protein [Shouchella patagoniensis]|uniref:DUF2500 family protein n=1 Tax=Shouchella patagoniensis TaxID=228576 RepID=UPI0009949E69